MIRVRWLLMLCLAVLAATGCAGGGRGGGGGPAVPAIALTKVTDGLTRPLHLTAPGDGSGRLFVLEQPGRVRILREGKVLAEPFLDLTEQVRSSGNEQGLLGLAFAPNYARSGVFYVHYTGQQGQTVIARYQVSAQNPDRADAGSAEVLLTVEQPFSNHNGGAILFGPDGYLYIALGDGGSAGDPQNNGQNLSSLLGKLLRIDVRQPGPYRIPPDNPFVGQAGARGEIWAYGLRNPWRVSFDRATGDLYIADVGQNALEEINLQPAGSKGGQNYGWRVYEGSRIYKGNELKNVTFPVIEYDHGGGNCSVTGGYVYRGKAIPDLVGAYIYGDYCSGRIWAARAPARAGGQWSTTELMQAGFRISAFGEDEQGELYVIDHGGAVHRMALP